MWTLSPNTSPTTPWRNLNLLLGWRANLGEIPEERQGYCVKLLLAEDEHSLSRALTAILQRNHYLVDAVYDGQEALDYLECGEYDGVILDIMMPKVDGLTVLKTLRRRGNPVPVLLLTARERWTTRWRGWTARRN